MSDKEYSYNIIADGTQSVTTAGTAVALASTETLCRAVVIQAEPENTGIIVVGASTVVAASGSRRGFTLLAGASVTFRVKNLADLYIDSTVSGESVSFTYFNN